jgi:hypothetical protein
MKRFSSAFLKFTKEFYSKEFLIALVVFTSLNILLYLFIYFFHGLIPFDYANYLYNAHHFIEAPQVRGEKFEFLNSLGQYDAQWYLKIAQTGYPKNPTNLNMSDKQIMDGLTYAFFPLYPLAIFATNQFIKNLELTAFTLSNLLLIINFLSLYFVIKKVSPKNIAIKTCFLLFFFPFSIFFRSYFTEGIQLFFIIWFCFFMMKNQFFLAGLTLAILNISKGNVWLINLYYVYILWRQTHLFILKKLSFSFIPISLFLSWMVFCYFQTGNFLYFFSIRSAWNQNNLLLNPLMNIFNMIRLPNLPLHEYHASQIDSSLMLITLVILILSKFKKILPSLFWWVSFLLWLTPFLFTDTMSFSRYQIISFPLFFYLAKVLPNSYFKVLLGAFVLGLFITSLFFVNWYWIG